MEAFVGVLIRRERLRQNYSQEGLCRGICAVSYLSKIEQGKAEAGEDVVLPLLHRLGVDFETDEAFLTWAGARIDVLYQELLAGREREELFRQTLAELEERKERCLQSPWMLDLLLLKAGTGEEVKAELLEQYGAVSEPVARAMAEGARRVLGCDLAVSTTGVAGPDSDERGNPVGLVYVALATPEGTHVRELHAGTGRERVRTAAAHNAFDLVRRYCARLAL